MNVENHWLLFSQPQAYLRLFRIVEVDTNLEAATNSNVGLDKVSDRLKI